MVMVRLADVSVQLVQLALTVTVAVPAETEAASTLTVRLLFPLEPEDMLPAGSSSTPLVLPMPEASVQLIHVPLAVSLPAFFTVAFREKLAPWMAEAG